MQSATSRICKPVILFLLIIPVILSQGCKSENKELKKEAVTIAGTMCKSIELMHKLKSADPGDSATVAKLQADEQKMQAEMAEVYRVFREKYRKDLDKPEFNKEFSTMLREAMLECKYLSKEDRENFEKDLGK